jgi:hypothetical protein
MTAILQATAHLLIGKNFTPALTTAVARSVVDAAMMADGLHGLGRLRLI